MANHVFGNENRIEHLAVVNGKCQADELRRDHRAARPCLDRRLLIRGLRLLDFLHQVRIDERTFFNRASHKSLLVLHWLAVAAHQNKPVGKFLLVAGAISLGLQTPWRCQLLPTAAAL